MQRDWRGPAVKDLKVMWWDVRTHSDLDATPTPCTHEGAWITTGHYWLHVSTRVRRDVCSFCLILKMSTRMKELLTTAHRELLFVTWTWRVDFMQLSDLFLIAIFLQTCSWVSLWSAAAAVADCKNPVQDSCKTISNSLTFSL